MIVSEWAFVLLACLLLPLSHAAVDLIAKMVDNVDPIKLYEPFEFIGDGSSGRVYKAHVKSEAKGSIPGLNEEMFVAIKIIPVRKGKSENVAREVAILKTLKPHPGTIKYLSSHLVNAPFRLGGEEQASDVHGEGDNTAVTQYVWVVTKWIEGMNLSHVVDDHASAVRAGEIPPSPACENAQVRAVGRSLFKTLKHLHTQKILHGDIDISNVMLIGGSEPVLLDMGNADKDPSRFDEDILRLTYALVEMSMKPVVYPDGFDDGPLKLKAYDPVRKVAIRVFLNKIRQREWTISDDLYEFVTYVLDTPTLTLDVVMKHPYIVL